MILVIQCAGTKRSDAGYLKTKNGRNVLFVADPAKTYKSPDRDDDVVYARPDDLADDGGTWRKQLERYNKSRRGNPLGLCRAFELYKDRIYRELVEQCGMEQTFILSAGWGMISAEYLTPCYDITFSQSERNTYKFRDTADSYEDFCHLPDGVDEPLVLFASKRYLPLFFDLTHSYRGRRIVFYYSKEAPKVPGCTYKRFETPKRTNWQYECAKAFLAGDFNLD
jgi:hypothetical protein